MEQPSRRGFASMDPERRRELAARGGRAAQARGTGHSWTEGAAREAGRKGGRAVGADREYMSLIGREGGRLRRLAAAEARAEANARALESTIEIVAPVREQPGMP